MNRISMVALSILAISIAIGVSTRTINHWPIYFGMAIGGTIAWILILNDIEKKIQGVTRL